MFLIVKICLDIAFSTLVASHFANNPPYQYKKAIKTIFKYLKEIKVQEIIYSEKDNLKIFCSLDFN